MYIIFQIDERFNIGLGLNTGSCFCITTVKEVIAYVRARTCFSTIAYYLQYLIVIIIVTTSLVLCVTVTVL